MAQMRMPVGRLFPTIFFTKYGGLSFILKCNYDAKFFEKNPLLFYRELLEYFRQLSRGGKWSFQKYGSRKIFVKFLRSRSLNFCADVSVSES